MYKNQINQIYDKIILTNIYVYKIFLPSKTRRDYIK
jgi:hypothetical protein